MSNPTIAMKPPDDVTIGALMDQRARSDPNHCYCVFKGRRSSFGEINALVNRVANGLLDRGFQPGTRMGVMLSSHPDHIITLLALLKAGMVRVPINTNAKGASLDHTLIAFGVEAVIADGAYERVLRSALQNAGLEDVVWRGSVSGACDLTFEHLLDHSNASAPSVGVKATDVTTIVSSSGTTGAPKGVLKTDKLFRAGAMIGQELADISGGDILHLWEPLHHGAGAHVIVGSILKPITLIMVERFSASNFWNEVREHSVTRVHYLGSIVPVLMKQPARSDDRDHKARIAWGGGCPNDLWDAFSERFGVEIREGYGLSEATSFVTVNKEGRKGSIGRPVSYFEMKLFDSDGAVEPGKIGEILIKAREPGLNFQGYFANPQASAEAVQDGWLRTGDLASQDEDGYLYFKGRKKDVIRRRGVNISAWEVEKVIGEHPDVRECAVIAVPSEVGEDDLKLFIQLQVNTSLDPLALINWCEPRMPYYQIPRYIEVIPEFPKTPTERIRKGELSRAVDACWDLTKSGYVINRDL